MKWKNKIFFSDSRNMNNIPNESIDLIITSPPYFNIKNYSKNGYQNKIISKKINGQIGDCVSYNEYINDMLCVWKECERILKPNGKLCINTPLVPMLKKNIDTHYNRHIFDINSDIQQSIIKKTNMFLMDLYIWNRTNPLKKLMFGSYPYPRNYYAQNTSEFIAVYVKDGKPINNVSEENKMNSKLTKDEWIKYTKQIWDIPIPNKSDLAFGIHCAIMPEEIVKRCVKLFSFVGDIVLDPFAGSGTTLRVAKKLNRNYVGYEISKSYEKIIALKLGNI